MSRDICVGRAETIRDDALNRIEADLETTNEDDHKKENNINSKTSQKKLRQ